MEEEYLHIFFNFFKDQMEGFGMAPSLALGVGTFINVVLVSLVLLLLDILTRKVILQLFRLFSAKSKNTFDDYLMQSNFPRYFAHTVPLFVLWVIEPSMFMEYPWLRNVLRIILNVYLIILGILLFRSLLRTTINYLRKDEKYGDKPLESYLQVLMIFAWGLGLFLIINNITGYSWASLTTLGAASAAILLIFKDTILGFVASIQISVNDIVRIGDWITFSKYGADGYVTEINLASVRVQNFDKTYTTIPTYSLISDSFQNWRGMQNSDGRRIKRAIYIKQNSVRFLTDSDINRFEKIKLISHYITQRQKDITEHNHEQQIDSDEPLNYRQQTNLGVFRKYIDAYLHQNPAINDEMFLMVRHLDPTEKGIPLEIYCFSKDKRWENYEHIIADIFDHVIAAVSHFDLELFELPSGIDLRSIKA